MGNTIGTIVVNGDRIVLKPFEGKEEVWEESKKLINSVGTKFIIFEGKKYYPEK